MDRVRFRQSQMEDPRFTQQEQARTCGSTDTMGNRRAQVAKATGKRLPIHAFVPHDLRRTGRTTLGRLGVTPFIGERVINHSKDVLEETYDLWDYFDEKRDALERFETYLLQFRDNETTNVSGKGPSASDRRCETCVPISANRDRGANRPSWRRKEKKAPRAGPSSCTIVQREPISSSGCRQLPILRQHHRIDGVNDSVRRDQIRFHDTGCVDAHVR